MCMSIMLIKTLHLFHTCEILVNWKNSQVIKTNVLSFLKLFITVYIGLGAERKKFYI